MLISKTNIDKRGIALLFYIKNISNCAILNIRIWIKHRGLDRRRRVNRGVLIDKSLERSHKQAVKWRCRQAFLAPLLCPCDVTVPFHYYPRFSTKVSSKSEWPLTRTSWELSIQYIEIDEYIRATYPFQWSEIVFEKCDGIVGPGHTKLDNTILEQLLDVVLLHVGFALAQRLLLVLVARTGVCGCHGGCSGIFNGTSQTISVYCQLNIIVCYTSSTARATVNGRIWRISSVPIGCMRPDKLSMYDGVDGDYN